MNGIGKDQTVLTAKLLFRSVKQIFSPVRFELFLSKQGRCPSRIKAG